MHAFLIPREEEGGRGCRGCRDQSPCMPAPWLSDRVVLYVLPKAETSDGRHADRSTEHRHIYIGCCSISVVD
jgi:hypothetical protein